MGACTGLIPVAQQNTQVECINQIVAIDVTGRHVHLVPVPLQQGGELAYLLLHDPQYRCVRREHLVEGAVKLKLGDPRDPNTDVGPMIREADAVRAAEWIDEAVAAGAKLLCGGHRNGSFVEPTVLTETKPGMRVNCLEVFAPVVTVEAYDDFNDALRRVNDSPWGLQAGLFTRDARLIFRAFEELQVGGVIAGDIPTWRMDQMPYGGVKDSVTGREGLKYAIEEMTERKLLVMNVQ